MDHVLSLRPSSACRPGLRIPTSRVRLIHEDPPANNGQYFRYSVQEAFVRKYMRLMEIEAVKTNGGKGSKFVEVMTRFFIRARKLRRTLDNELCVYWMTSTVTVCREDGEETPLPVVTCIVVDSRRSLGFGFRPILDDIDQEESDCILHLTMSTAQSCPPLSGNEIERAEANGLIDTLHEGLIEGYQISAHPVLYPYKNGN